MSSVQIATPVIDRLLLASTPVATFDGERRLTSASGFFFQQGTRLFLVTSAHVLLDLPSGHHPNRVELLLHQSGSDLRPCHLVSLWLYENGRALWRQAGDSGGEVDVALLEIPSLALPLHTQWAAFGPHQLQPPPLRIGAPVLIVGFPLGFHDTLHHLPVVRGAVVASAWGIRFQGKGCFVTDAPMHRGSSGAPVVCYDPAIDPLLPWQLLGVHAARMDMQGRDQQHDASLGLNLAWYADVLLALSL